MNRRVAESMSLADPTDEVLDEVPDGLPDGLPDAPLQIAAGPSADGATDPVPPDDAEPPAVAF